MSLPASILRAWRQGLVATALCAVATALGASAERASAGDVLPVAVAITAGALAGTTTGHRAAIAGAAAGALIGTSARLAFAGWSPGEPLTPTPLALLLHHLGASTTALPRAILALGLVCAAGAYLGVAWHGRSASRRPKT